MKQYYTQQYQDKRRTKVIMIPILTDNYVFILTDDSKKAFIVDPGMAEPVCEIVESLGLNPTHLLITHSHADHIGGVPEIMQLYPRIQKIDFVSSGPAATNIKFNERGFQIFQTPGHWPDHICFFEMENQILFCGDILFRFGCGRIFSGTFEELFQSLQKIKALPGETDVFCTHEYTAANLSFCIENKRVDPAQFTDTEKEKLGQIPTLPVSLQTELKYNPFLKATNVSEFTKLRILRNEFKFKPVMGESI